MNGAECFAAGTCGLTWTMHSELSKFLLRSWVLATPKPESGTHSDGLSAPDPRHLFSSFAMEGLDRPPKIWESRFLG